LVIIIYKFIIIIVSDDFQCAVVTMAAKFLKFATFPWVALTPTDRHVLSSTDELVFTVHFSAFLSSNSLTVEQLANLS